MLPGSEELSQPQCSWSTRVIQRPTELEPRQIVGKWYIGSRLKDFDEITVSIFYLTPNKSMKLI